MVDNAVKYQLLEDSYSVSLSEPEGARAGKTIDVKPGEDTEVVLQIP